MHKQTWYSMMHFYNLGTELDNSNILILQKEIKYFSRHLSKKGGYIRKFSPFPTFISNLTFVMFSLLTKQHNVVGG